MDMFPYRPSLSGNLMAMFLSPSQRAVFEQAQRAKEEMKAARAAITTNTNAVSATVSGSDIVVRWSYPGNANFFFVQKYRNGSFKGNTKVSASARSYTYQGVTPSPSRKLHFVVYADTSSGLKKVGQSEVIEGIPAPPQGLLDTLDEISKARLGLPLTSEMQLQYAQKFADYRNKEGLSTQQAFDKINAEFAAAVAAKDVAFFESRTGQKFPTAKQTTTVTKQTTIDKPTAQRTATATTTSDVASQAVPDPATKTAGASGGSNLLIYGAIAAVGAYLLFGTGNAKPAQVPAAKPGLSGTSKKKHKSRTPAKRVTQKAKGSPATKSKKSGRMQVIDL